MVTQTRVDTKLISRAATPLTTIFWSVLLPLLLFLPPLLVISVTKITNQNHQLHGKKLAMADGTHFAMYGANYRF